MDSNSKLDSLIETPISVDTTSSPEERAKKIQDKINASQSKSDFADFGIVKIWVVLVEFFSVFYARTQERKIDIENLNLNNKNKLKTQEKK
jgi:hypothetical protein